MTFPLVIQNVNIRGELDEGYTGILCIIYNFLISLNPQQNIKLTKSNNIELDFEQEIYEIIETIANKIRTIANKRIY